MTITAFVRANADETISMINSRSGKEKFTSTAQWVDKMVNAVDAKLEAVKAHEGRIEKSGAQLQIERCERYIASPDMDSKNPLQRLQIVAQTLNLTI